MALTDKQSKFIDEYLVDLNATQAAIRAGYSKNAAGVIGHENLTKPDIQEAISQKMKERAERTLITAEEVILGIRSIADDALAKDSDRLKGYELLGKHLGLFNDRFTIDTQDTVITVKLVD